MLILAGRANSPENSSPTKIDEHIPFGYSIASIWAFSNIQNRHSFYLGKDFMKRFCSSLREPPKNIIHFEKIKCYR